MLWYAQLDVRRWRLLDTVLQDKMFETLLQLVVEQDVPLHAVPVTDIVTAFVTDGGESLVAKHCLKLLSKVSMQCSTIMQ
jgi:Sister chromatid cohesion protein Dcc1